MKAQLAKHSAFIATALSLLLVTASGFAATQDTWTGVRSTNFLVIVNAGEKDIRQVAMGLEQFREVFSHLLPEDHFDPTTPTIVIVFRDQLSYAPFKPFYREQPLRDVAGHFQPGTQVNYLTFAVDQGKERDTLSVAFHEYVHLLVKNGFRNAPLWFKDVQLVGDTEVFDAMRDRVVGVADTDLEIKDRPVYHELAAEQLHVGVGLGIRV